MDSESQEALSALKPLFEQMLKYRETAGNSIANQNPQTICATGRFYSELPFEAERQQERKGKIITCRSNFKDGYKFQLDSRSRLICSQGFDSGRLRAEVLVEYLHDKAIARRYAFFDSAQAARISQLDYADGLHTNTVTLEAEDNFTLESYEYDGEKRLISIEMRKGKIGQPEFRTYRYHFNYQKPDCCTVTLNDAIVFTFDPKLTETGGTARAPDQQEVDSIVQTMVELLADAIYSNVKKVKLATPIFGIAINYNTDPSQGVIPEIGIGEANDDDAKFQTPQAFAKKNEELLNPANFRLFATPNLHVKDKKIVDLDHKIRQLARDGAKIDNRKIAIAVAKELNLRDWSDIETTKAFLVYAVDDDMVDLSKNIKAIRQ